MAAPAPGAACPANPPTPPLPPTPSQVELARAAEAGADGAGDPKAAGSGAESVLPEGGLAPPASVRKLADAVNVTLETQAADVHLELDETAGQGKLKAEAAAAAAAKGEGGASAPRTWAYEVTLLRETATETFGPAQQAALTEAFCEALGVQRVELTVQATDEEEVTILVTMAYEHVPTVLPRPQPPAPLAHAEERLLQHGLTLLTTRTVSPEQTTRAAASTDAATGEGQGEVRERITVAEAEVTQLEETLRRADLAQVFALRLLPQPRPRSAPCPLAPAPELLTALRGPGAGPSRRGPSEAGGGARSARLAGAGGDPGDGGRARAPQPVAAGVRAQGARPAAHRGREE